MTSTTCSELILAEFCSLDILFFFSKGAYSGNTLLEAFFKATFLYLGWQSLQHVCSVFHQLPSMKIRYTWCFVTGTFGTAMLLRASLRISSKQQVLQSTIKKPAVFKGSNLVRKTSKQITLLGIELNSPGAVSPLKSLFIPRLGERMQPSVAVTQPSQVGIWQHHFSSQQVSCASHSCVNACSQMHTTPIMVFLPDLPSKQVMQRHWDPASASIRALVLPERQIINSMPWKTDHFSLQQTKEKLYQQWFQMLRTSFPYGQGSGWGTEKSFGKQKFYPPLRYCIAADSRKVINSLCSSLLT